MKVSLARAVCIALVLSGAAASLADTLMPLPAYGNTFNGNVRGYYFTAPADFVITGLRVPDETQKGVQSVAVVRFDNNTPPPNFSATTNAFQQLALFVGEPSANILAVNIPVSTGDVIGIYGQCTNSNSYGTPAGPFLSEIMGLPTTLTRSGMQFQLGVAGMHDIWAEPAGQVSRVEMYYVPEPTTLGMLALAGLLIVRRR
jgi:hypothetical protein